MYRNKKQVRDDTQGKRRESTGRCKGCTEVERLLGEVEDLRMMMESLKRMVTGQGLEEKRGETGDQ